MVNVEETKRYKAKQMRYKKSIAKDLNLDKIKEDLWDIQEACEEIRWYTDSEDGEDSLVNALAGDEDETYEFKMAFADLCAECERMQEDLQEEWVPECFDIFFVAAGAGDLFGWDSYEQDYFGISANNTQSDYCDTVRASGDCSSCIFTELARLGIIYYQDRPCTQRRITLPSLNGNTITYIKDGQLKRVTCGRHEEAVEFYEEVRHGKKMV